jgi:hypothetical protein
MDDVQVLFKFKGKVPMDRNARKPAGWSGLSRLFGLFRLFGFSRSSNKTNQIDQTDQMNQANGTRKKTARWKKRN